MKEFDDDFDDDNENDFDAKERPNKSHHKRLAQATLDLVKQLIALSDKQLERFTFDPEISEALKLARSIKARGGKQRQVKRVAKLLRATDQESIIKQLAIIDDTELQAKQQFHQLEEWRDKLIAGNDSVLSAFIDEHPHADRQQLRQVIRLAKKELQMDNNQKKQQRALFQLLKQVIAAPH